MQTRSQVASRAILTLALLVRTAGVVAAEVEQRESGSPVEEITVTSTRIPRRIADEPARIEVIGPGVGRLGVETFYTGRQNLTGTDTPNRYRTRSPGFVELGLLVERHFGPVNVSSTSACDGDSAQLALQLKGELERPAWPDTMPSRSGSSRRSQPRRRT